MKKEENPPLKGRDCLDPNLEGVSNPLHNKELKNPGLKAGVSTSRKVIRIENLSKKYVIYHQQQGAYSTIVDSLTRTAKRWVKKIARPFQHASEPERTAEEFWALKDVSFDVDEGDRVGILGKNGAGKSTLLKVLSRIIEPTRGRVRIYGRISSLLEVGTGFHPELTGRENIFLNGAILGMSKQEIARKFDEIVAFSEVERFLDTPVKYYSSGMYGRLGFAIAAHLDPDILIVDEVLAVGDAAFQEKCLKKMDTVSKEGRTILFVTHNTAAILSLCNKGILLEGGAVKAAGAIEPCVNEYVKKYRAHSLEWQGVLGDQSLRLYRAALLHPQRDKDFFYSHEKAHIEIEGEILGLLKDQYLLGFVVKDQRDQVIAHSYVHENKEVWDSLQSPGRFSLQLDLDASFFWEGEYALSLVYGMPQRMVGGSDVQLKFTVYRTPNAASFANVNNTEGVILPHLWRLSSA
jgi:lipopolysaccharide transport system ATP-binding protein